MIRHFDHFVGVRTSSSTDGNLGDISFWDVTTPESTLKIGYSNSHAYLNIDGAELDARHKTNANLGDGLPASFNVEAAFRLTHGGRVFGLTALADATPNSANRVRVFVNVTGVDTGSPFTYGLNVPGFTEQLWFTPAAGGSGAGFTFDIDDPAIYHVMILRCDYIAQSAAGNPIFTFSLQIDDVVIFTSAQRELSYWTSAMTSVGFFGRRETTPVTATTVQSLVACDWFRSVDLVRREHNPAPALKAAVVRTEIVPDDETAPGTIPVFPYEVRLLGVKLLDPHRIHTSHAGYTATSPKQPSARREFSCAWIGNKADRDAFETFVDDNVGNFFRITIRAQGIGTVNVQFLAPESDFAAITNDIHRTEFKLIEVADAS